MIWIAASVFSLVVRGVILAAQLLGRHSDNDAEVEFVNAREKRQREHCDPKS